jgi:hypothetical protein
MESASKDSSELASLRKQLAAAEIEIKSLRLELERTAETLARNDEETTMIAHIKGTLIQFLKNLPLTDPKNEELLKIIYSMMEFNANEINDLYSQRLNVKVNSK